MHLAMIAPSLIGRGVLVLRIILSQRLLNWEMDGGTLYISAGSGGRIRMGSKFVKGVNDLETWCRQNNREDLLNEWDPTNEVTPNQISYGSHKVVKWVCQNGHHYEKDVHSRCAGVGCSACSGFVFKPRGRLFDEYPELIKEIDTSKNTYDEIKNYTSGSTKPIFWVCKNGHSYDRTPVNKIKSKECPICSNERVVEGINDLKTWCEANGRAQIIEDWDYSKNKILPTEVSYGSNRKVWFKCHICGHKWQTVISSRTTQQADCMSCQRRMRSSFPEQCIFYYASKYFPDTINGDMTALDGKELDVYVPSLKFAVEYDGHTWHKDTDKDVNKDKLCKDNGIVLYRIRETKCEELHSEDSITFEYDYQDWSALSKIISDILSDMGIKEADVNIIRDEFAIKEQYYKRSLENSLAKLYPEVAKEWFNEKNEGITPDLVTPQTHDRYYWKCSKCGKIYLASPHNRINVGSGCPDCGAKKAHRAQSFAVINLDTGERFESAAEAAKKYSLTKYAISFCCRGITQTCGGYRWKYDESQLSEAHRLASERRSAGNAERQQKVLNIDTGEVYDSLRDAQAKTHIHNISAVCRGVRPLAGGYRWKYISDDPE